MLKDIGNLLARLKEKDYGETLNEQRGEGLKDVLIILVVLLLSLSLLLWNWYYYLIPLNAPAAAALAKDSAETL